MNKKLKLLIETYEKRLSLIRYQLKQTNWAGKDVILRTKEEIIESFLHELKQLNKD